MDIGLPIIISNQENRELLKTQLESKRAEATILEPLGKNTAPAIALAAFYLREKSSDALMLISPSDHIINNHADFIADVRKAEFAAAEGAIVTFGIKPEYAETGYGYILPGNKKSSGCFSVRSFLEKPSARDAEKFFSSGNYLWNSGIFLMKPSLYLSELYKYSPDIYLKCELAYKNAKKENGFIYPDKKYFSSCPSDSIDYALMEKTERALVFPANFDWSDFGSWRSAWQIGSKDDNGNVVDGFAETFDTKHSYIKSDGPEIITMGLEGIMVVATKDNRVLVAPMSRAQEIKKIVEGNKVAECSFYKSPIGYIKISGNDNEITSIDFVEEEPYLKPSKNQLFEKLQIELDEYFQGKRKSFSICFSTKGTDFQKNVWGELAKIPFGKTKSYKDIAEAIKNDKAVRAVGMANNKNKLPIIIPCHRVIGSNNKLVGYAGGLWRKEWLLNHEKKFS